MSFSDIGKRRLNRARDEQSSFAKHQARKPTPTLRYFYGDTNDLAILEPSKQVKEDFAKSQPQRGVRPHLNHVCPVTEKPLMEMESPRDEDTSAVTSFSYGFDDADDDASFPAPVSTASRPRQADSEFALLNKEIVNFQKMVADLDQAMAKSADSPEAQWKIRILSRSAQEAQQDIQNRLLEFGETSRRRNDGRGQMAMRKLVRDFARAQENFGEVTQSHIRKQQAEVSLFRSTVPEESEEEEFFDRAMREREQEVNNIHQSMRTVNEIYQDLADIVDGQQEKIDNLADRVEESKSNTKYGLEQIQDAVMGMCAPMETGDAGDHSWSAAMDDVFEMASSCTEKMGKVVFASDDEPIVQSKGGKDSSKGGKSSRKSGKSSSKSGKRSMRKQ
ncbi:unnamed protein product [Cylindrotheca closterium]|uniref:t-SNARE coiled-coil homology domain-containing protein n=1 Tax=Cylindrotheca closterium TaxID=2856 RepID=A0AAD2FS79_9STRA|nr:unnamed protein product [Cylindrotheca closterium]